MEAVSGSKFDGPVHRPAGPAAVDIGPRARCTARQRLGDRGALVLAHEQQRRAAAWAAAWPTAVSRRPTFRVRPRAAMRWQNRFQLFMRNGVMKLMGVPWVARLAAGKSFNDAIRLPPPPDT